MTFYPMLSIACPACAGGAPGAKLNQTPYSLIILGTFILLTYIPFYLFFRATKKFDPKNLDEHL